MEKLNSVNDMVGDSTGGNPLNMPDPKGNRQKRRKQKAVARKAKKQAYKVLRGGVGNQLISVPMSTDASVSTQPVTSVP